MVPEVLRVELVCHVLGQRDGAGERAGGKSKMRGWKQRMRC